MKSECGLLQVRLEVRRSGGEMVAAAGMVVARVGVRFGMATVSRVIIEDGGSHVRTLRNDASSLPCY